MPARKVYFLYDSKAEQWCGYRREPEWLLSAAKALGALVAGYVEYTDDHLSTIEFSAEDETGDSVVFDTYLVDKAGKLRSLKRTTNVLPGQRSVLEKWIVQDGKPVKQSSITRDLSTLKPIAPEGDSIPGAPIYTSVSELPFWPLADGRRQEVWSNGKVCVAGGT